MTLIIPECIYCKKDIEKDEQALVIVPYPKKKGFTEIKAFLNIEGKFICENCKEKLSI
ncbi:Fe3+ hydroxamate ABC transporter substrate-binding protein [Lysinibacillus sp. 3P01SB]|uniref:Fe3+ hydroxamate ABC transporter substrate-binding protein n=1 Tax=Lysinibacillus sp. 3P01SB TaxID=3132284 RepID=UPI0039A50BDE